MKIAFYINVLWKGGAERALSTLANAMARRGHDCVFITSYATEDGEYPLLDAVKRVNLESEDEATNSGALKRNIRRVIRLRRICKAEKPDVLISFLPEANFRSVIATYGLRTKTIVSVRNDPAIEYGSMPSQFLSRILYRSADHVVFQTDDASRWFSKNNVEKSSVILNPVSDIFFNTQPCPAGNVVVNCARLQEQKNQALLIEAFAFVASSYPDWNLHIYGEGPLHPNLQEQINSLNLSGRACLKGSTDDVAGVLSTSSIFVLSSDYEGLPNALLESMAVGVPSISTDCPCGGPRSVIEDGVDGLLVPVGDSRMLADSLDRLMRDGSLRKKMGANSKRKAEAFRESSITDNWERLCRILTNE